MLIEALWVLESHSDDEATRSILRATIDDIEDGSGERRELGLMRGREVVQTTREHTSAEHAKAQTRASTLERFEKDMNGARRRIETNEEERRNEETLAQVGLTIRRAVRAVEEKGIGRPLQPVLIEIFRARGEMETHGSRINQTIYLADRAGATLGVRYHYEKEDSGPAAEFIGAALTQAEIAGKIANIPRKVKGRWVTPFYKRTEEEWENPEGRIGLWTKDETSKAMHRLALASDGAIETAANLVFIKESGTDEDPVEELRKRNTTLIEGKRLGYARQLIEGLELEM